MAYYYYKNRYALLLELIIILTIFVNYLSIFVKPVEVLKEHLPLLVGRYVPTKIIRVLYKDKPWFEDQYRGAFGLKQEAHLRWTRHLGLT